MKEDGHFKERNLNCSTTANASSISDIAVKLSAYALKTRKLTAEREEEAKHVDRINTTADVMRNYSYNRNYLSRLITVQFISQPAPPCRIFRESHKLITDCE